MNLPESRRDVRRSPALSPKQLLAVLTPIAAVAAVAVALVSSGGTNSNENAASAGQTTTSRGAAAEGAKQDNTAPQTLRKFRAVAGPADEVATQLRSKGIDARVVKRRVQVRGATRDQVDAALGNRRAGKVEIVIVR